MAKPPRKSSPRRHPVYHGPRRIVSGGQSGVDRAALDAALALGLEAGGWCPAGRWAEDGPIHPRYRLDPAPVRHVARRTALNVRDSDATLILAPGRARGGTRWTVLAAIAHGRPLLLADPAAVGVARRIKGFLRRHRPRTLNVAGPRASEAPGIYGTVRRLLGQVLPGA